ncbi:MAG: UDP-N-acetylglucosamine-1-phosphate transferase, partial [Thermoproteota archaeon]|nr:UDP-N-acetylglucosamine-1-phosphate transferase [Thermoproteota archaeon]
MLDGINLITYAAAVSAISFFGVLLVTPAAIRSLVAKGMVVPDAHKPEKPQVPRPAGPVIMISIAAAEIVLFILTLNVAVFAILLTTTIAFFVGYIDDSRVMPGWFKPVALLAAAIPLVLLDIYIGNVYGDSLNLIFGGAYIPLL